MRRRRRVSAVVMLSLALSLLTAGEVRADTYTVTTTADAGVGSLRWAIGQANLDADPDTIAFAIPAGDAGCDAATHVCTIYLLSALPILSAGQTTIDGYTQAGASPATSGQAATVTIELDGSGAGAVPQGLGIASASNHVRGLAITGFVGNGIAIGGAAAVTNIVEGNYLGVAPAGVEKGNGLDGVFIGLGAQDNVVGGDAPAERNILSGNGWDGVGIHGAATTGNQVSGNYIGTNPSGTGAVPNGFDGVRIYGGAHENIVGGEAAGMRNIISGNAGDGVRILGEGSDANLVEGNIIGIAVDGHTALGNVGYGVMIMDGAERNEVAGNTISANAYGVYIHHSTLTAGSVTAFNVVQFNVIGLSIDGQTPLGNTSDGINIGFGGQGNTVYENVIAHNGNAGVAVGTPTAFNNAIVTNSIHDNAGKGIELTNGANHGMVAPTLHDVDPNALTVSGAACPGCLIEVFAGPDDDGEGRLWLGSALAGPAGDFTVAVDQIPSPYLTATASRLGDGTSEFSGVFTASIPVLATSTKTAMLSRPLPGHPLTYTITLRNTGTAAAAAIVTDTLPAEVTWVADYTLSTGSLTYDAAETRLIWHATVAVGSQDTIVYQVALKDDIAPGTTIINTATVYDGVIQTHSLWPVVVTIDFEQVYLPFAIRQ